MQERLGDISSLPVELQEMVIRKGRPSSIKNKVAEIIDRLEGKATVSELIVELYRTYDHTVSKRSNLIQLLLGYVKTGFLVKEGNYYMIADGTAMHLVNGHDEDLETGSVEQETAKPSKKKKAVAEVEAAAEDFTAEDPL